MQNQDQQQPSYSQQSADRQFKPSGESYVGIKDWLRTFVVLFALQAASDIYSLFSLFANSIGVREVIGIILYIISGAMAASAAVLILMRKKIGKQVAIANIVVGTVAYVVYMIVVGIATNAEVKDAGFVVTWFGGITLLAVLVDIACILYFLKSRRVKETLVN
ncbi:hypothetical protein LRM44_02935 [Candidatus Nanosynbacter sp. HMT-352]|uniref:hypothetical protein n=1 Tax=Candidatus Nanosynbacter sp. HMT-352 TaxID=2899133 RepID=UPI001FB6169B|nr:hypothetical protein [Candidatus Nanosynbacter sp. HMT-352]UOG66227.1 hypothetical protein LRM44_02935 [Candidatus Nanosynbacter sp. HMT-352]